MRELRFSARGTAPACYPDPTSRFEPRGTGAPKPAEVQSLAVNPQQVKLKGLDDAHRFSHCANHSVRGRIRW